MSTTIPSLSAVQNAENQIPIVGIGASAGGLNAFKEFFKHVPSNSGMAFILIQHLDPNHESMMVDLLSNHTSMKVIQVNNNMRVEPNRVYMIPPNRFISIHQGVLRAIKPTQPRGLRMPIDYFLNSLAEDQKEKAICIILSGTGTDGSVGLKSIKSLGGMSIAQVPEEAQYDGMPKSAIATGVVDHVAPIKDMPELLTQYVTHSYVHGNTTGQKEEPEPSDFQKVLEITQNQLGHNFKYYKKNTLYRRINRRMGLKAIEKMGEYAKYINKNPVETEELFKDLLIGVTGFFREKESWEDLEKYVFTKFFENDHTSTIRVWVAGCSTGEEPYTIAMVLNECFEREGLNADFNIFATDIDSHALDVARTGRYTQSIANDIPEHLLNKYFKKEDGFYRVSAKLRENIVFSVQNLISDPPFSKLDLITCRNLLIYLESEIQLRVTELFHFALKRNGYLMLGNSETIGQNDHLFRPLSKKWRIYERLGTPIPSRANFPIVPSGMDWNGNVKGVNLDTTGNKHPGDIIKEALLSKYAPTSVLITRAHEILFHFGDTEQFLKFPQGEHTSDLYALIRDGLTTRMRGAVHKAIRGDKPVSVSGARIKRDGKYRKVKFQVTPLNAISDASEGLYLVSFEDEKQYDHPTTETDVPVEEEAIVKQLEHELNSTKEELQNTIEELETSNEELKASNEEVMSMNEELQSSNEELETSKEELQSLNEELNTVNSELQDKVISLESTNNDVTNLVNSTNIAVVFLDNHFNIKYYTPFSKKLFNLISTDINRPLKHITARFEDPDLLSDARKVLDTLNSSNAEILTDENEWYYRKIFPYRTEDNHIQGIILTFENITELKLQKELLQDRNLRYELAQKAATMGYWEHEIERDKIQWSDEMGSIFGLVPKQYPSSLDQFLELISKEDRVDFKKKYKAAVKGASTFNHKFKIFNPHGEIRFIENYGSFLTTEGKPVRCIHSVKDVTEKEKNREQKQHFELVLSAISDAVLVVNDNEEIVYSNNAAEELLKEKSSKLQHAKISNYLKDVDFKKTLKMHKTSVQSSKNEKINVALTSIKGPETDGSNSFKSYLIKVLD